MIGVRLPAFAVLLTASLLFLLAVSDSRAGGPEDRSVNIQEKFAVDASSKTVWEVLTDYDRMGTFVSTLRRSRVIERNHGEVLIEQESGGGFPFMHKKIRVQLKVLETPYESIRFEDVSGTDFKSYSGEWKIEPHGKGVEVQYGLKALPRFPAPNFVTKHIMRGAVRDLLEEVRLEIIKRERKIPAL